MLFSVIVPVYKVENYMDQCIDSVLNQPFRDFELILVDDGSPDRCGEICDEYAKKDSRVRVIHKENGGLSDARNAGLEIASGEYIMFLDSDDWIERNCLQEIADIVGISKPDLVFGHFIHRYAHSQKNCAPLDASRIRGKTKREIIDYIFCGCNPIPWSAWRNMIRLPLLKEHGIYFKKGILCEDAEFSPRVFLAAESFDVYEKPFYHYRLDRPGSIMFVDNPQRELDLLDTIHRHYEFAVNQIDDSEMRASVIKGFANYYAKVLFASEHVYRGNDRRAMRNAVKKELFLMKFVSDKKAKIIRSFYRICGYYITSWVVWAIWRIKLKLRNKLARRSK